MDHPIKECLNTCLTDLWPKGVTTYQKFTCKDCGKRMTIDEPNVFFVQGTCENCGGITDIAKTGCNYIAVFPKGE